MSVGTEETADTLEIRSPHDINDTQHESYRYGWDCVACTCPPKANNTNGQTPANGAAPPFADGGVYAGGAACSNDRCPAGQYVCCTKDEQFPDLVGNNANEDNTCGRLLYFPYVVACSAWSCAAYAGCGGSHKVEVSGCGCGCHKSGLTGWEIALIVLAGILGAFVLAVVAFQIFSCYRRSRALQRRDDNHNNSARYEPRSSRRSSRHPNGVSSARADVSPGTANGTALGSPATALEMARAEPVVGIPVWMDTSGAMLNGMGSQGPQRGHGSGEEEENAAQTSARMAAVECNREE